MVGPHAGRRRGVQPALRHRHPVLLHGPAAAGKTRVAAEAPRRVFPDRPLLIPADGPRLRELDLVPGDCVDVDALVNLAVSAGTRETPKG
ncbi:hypothetical protein [Amycolatopsis sp. cg9]|uniref:hypothetical protein n=1 Tax=Amycolatopsis sp. cg9 TaxID=3238801 RepID=UPI003525A215